MIVAVAPSTAPAAAIQLQVSRVPPPWGPPRAGSAGPGLPALSARQGGGRRETGNWIAAAGAVEGTTATIVDRVPIYASPIDTAFAYFNLKA